MNNRHEGFTLLEVVVALSVLIVVFGGVVSLIVMMSESEKHAKNGQIAALLASEALELVRYKRDLNYILDASPFSDIADETDAEVYSFTINYDGSVAPSSTSDVSQADILYSGTFYTQTVVSSPTFFRRLVTTTYHAAAGPLPARIDIAVEVYWKDDTKQDTYTLTSELLDIE